MTLWTASEAAAATGGAANGEWEATGVALDSRSVSAGDLFVAVAGANRDGHCFVRQALDCGAAAALVSRDCGADAPTLRVPDTRAGLYALARAARARSTARIAAVTGSVGKTGCQELLARLLERAGRTEASRGHPNNEWGAPPPRARLPRDADSAGFQLGLDHARGAAVINADTPHADRLAAAAERAGARVLRFSRQAGDAVLLEAALDAEGSDVAAEICGRRIAFRLGAPGLHWVCNALGALLLLEALDIAADADVLAEFRPLSGRGAQRSIGGWTLIDESYNASPAAVRAALEVLGLTAPGAGGRRIAVLGDMLELGADADTAHAALAGPVEEAGVDAVFTAGPGMRRLFDRLPPARRGAHMPDAAALAPFVADAAAPGDVVLVKGSLGMNMKAVIAALEQPAGKGG